MQLSNQHICITGGSSGIGLSIACQAAAAGARLSIIARDPAKLANAITKIRSENPDGAEIFAVSADVSIEADVLEAINAAKEKHGPVDILITSAGTAKPGYFEQIPVHVFEQTMAVNYFGTLYAIKAVTPSMISRKRGAIVMISSGAGLVGLFGYSAYAPTKFAIRGLAESLRGEMKQLGITVSVVYPPDTETPQLTQENQTKPPETKAITANAGLWTADAVARVTLKAVIKGQFCVTPGLQITALAWLHSFARPLFNWNFDRIANRARRKASH